MDRLKKRIADLKASLSLREQTLFEESLQLGNTPECAHEYVVSLRRLYEVYDDELPPERAEEGTRREPAKEPSIAKTA